MNEKQIVIIIGLIFLGRDNVADAIKKLSFVYIENEILRFIFIACRSLVRNGKSISKKTVLDYLRKETFTTARDLVAYSNAIDGAIQEALINKTTEEGDCEL